MALVWGHWPRPWGGGEGVSLAAVSEPTALTPTRLWGRGRAGLPPPSWTLGKWSVGLPRRERGSMMASPIGLWAPESGDGLGPSISSPHLLFPPPLRKKAGAHECHMHPHRNCTQGGRGGRHFPEVQRGGQGGKRSPGQILVPRAPSCATLQGHVPTSPAMPILACLGSGLFLLPARTPPAPQAPPKKPVDLLGQKGGEALV